MHRPDTVRPAMRSAHMNNVTISQLRAFVTVAELGSFSAAAVQLGVAQSSVSRAVACLEDAVGRVLLDRSSRASPTSAGAAVFRDARQALALVDGLGEAAAGEAVQGIVRIAAFRSAGEHLLPAV